MRVSVPVCSFRKPYSREFLESERFPPPATVYGFLLSLVGEEEREKYIEARIAIALSSKPEVSMTLRTKWRIKNKNLGLGLGKNKRPDYQELLTGLDFCVWVMDERLCPRLKKALASPSEIRRFGGLALGESKDLVNDVELNPPLSGQMGIWLSRDESGTLPFPVWVDHVGSRGTRWEQFSRKEGPLETPGPCDNRWIKIEPNLERGN
jgi:CRISPR-associated protein Cas5t